MPFAPAFDDTAIYPGGVSGLPIDMQILTALAARMGHQAPGAISGNTLRVKETALLAKTNHTSIQESQ